MPDPLRIAVSQQSMAFLDSWAGYVRRQEIRVRTAVERGAQFLLFPEWASLELSSLVALDPEMPVRRRLLELQDLHLPFVEFHQDLAARTKTHLLAPAFPVRVGHELRMRVYCFGRDGHLSFQEKIQLSLLERETWGLSPGRELRPIQTSIGQLGISIGEDVTYPHLVRTFCERGTALILAPASPMDRWAYARCSVGAAARALENQCFVALSVNLGPAPWLPPKMAYTGRAAVFGPPDLGFPDDGIVALSRDMEESWLLVNLDLEAQENVRRVGLGRNYALWPESLDLPVR